MKWKWAGGWTLILAGTAFLHYPFPVRDAVTEHFAPGFHWHFSASYLALAPFCSLADLLTLFSLHEMMICLPFLLLIALLWPSSWKRKALSLAALAGFLTWTVLAVRPAARLVAEAPDALLIDFHSHTKFSHDGRKSFSADDNCRWHWRQGFDAAFISDHNVNVAAQQGKVHSRLDWRQTGYRSLEGDEASLYETHLCVLAPHKWVNNMPYDGDFALIPRFIADMHKRGYLITANLPEYWRFHWKEARMDFLSWKVDGFEIVNSAPRSLDFPLALRRQIIEHCRQNHLFLTGVSDSHGWGYATAVWSVMRIPNWRAMDPDQLEQAILATLRAKTFDAVQVIEPVKFRPQTALELAVSPVADGWVYLRSLGWERALSWIAWIWLITGMSWLCGRRTITS